ncbi:MAG: hypothetical protein HYZ37_18860 [Candidatus Solibacter usitatus]|nr:hypothetical protein [Candidatus Solibacter usitatus]
MFQLKPLSHDAIPGALAKAERYRLLNEPLEARSICLDVLQIDPANQQALIMLFLSLSDRLGRDHRVFSEARELLPRLTDAYDRAYYAGILWERRAKARLEDGGIGAHHSVYDFLARAMQLFEEAEKLRHPHNDDAILRWNTCARFLMQHPEIAPPAHDEITPVMSE